MRVQLIALAFAVFSLSCASPSKTSTAAPASLRALTYNIHHGEGTDGRLDLSRIAALIRKLNPDLVALQEVDDRTTRTGGINQAAELGKLTGMHAVFGQAMIFQGGGYGQAILSRQPILSTRVHNLPQQAGREPRIAFVAETTAGKPALPLLFVSTHLDHQVESIRLQQATQLQTLLTNRAPIILCGDFNAVPESQPIRLFSTNWLDVASAHPQPTIPAENPRRRIDYIFLHPSSAWRVVETQVIEEPVASDHRPVLATIEFTGSAR